MNQGPLGIGVVGVGTMGKHHVRVYKELMDTSLVGITDADPDRAAAVADEFATDAVELDELLSVADAISVAVPTTYHYDITRAALEQGVHVLVEKPFVEDVDRGRELLSLARDRGLVLQIGHIERFNPAVRVLEDIVLDHELIAIDARRLGPPPDRDIADSSVMDLMIHDIDILLSLVDGDVSTVQATRAKNTPCVTAIISFDTGVVGMLTASRITQRKVRKLSVTARECQIDVDYTAQSIQIHRRSVPEYVVTDGDVRYRHESIIERPTVSNGEPLKEELQSFVDAIRQGTEPTVSGEDGLQAIELAKLIERQAAANPQSPPVLQNR